LTCKKWRLTAIFSLGVETDDRIAIKKVRNRKYVGRRQESLSVGLPDTGPPVGFCSRRYTTFCRMKQKLCFRFAASSGKGDREESFILFSFSAEVPGTPLF
jgi:hypothetical protein